MIATFRTFARGINNPTYAWQRKLVGEETFSNIDGATNKTLSVNVTDTSLDGALYRCAITNSKGTVYTREALLTVTQDVTCLGVNWSLSPWNTLDENFTYDEDIDIESYPGYAAAKFGASSTILTFTPESETMAFPFTLKPAFPLYISVPLRYLTEVGNTFSIATFTFATHEDFSGAWHTTSFYYAGDTTATYWFEFSGNDYNISLDTGISQVTDTEDTLMWKITNTSIEVRNFVTNELLFFQGGLNFTQLGYMDFSPQRFAGEKQGMIGGVTLLTAFENSCVSNLISPASQELDEGDPLFLEVIYSSDCDIESLSFQWFKDDEAIELAQSPQYYVPSSELSDAGDYYCAITNCDGVTNSDVATITVNSAGPTLFSAPPFAREDFVTSSESETEVNFEETYVSLKGTVDVEYIYRQVNLEGLTCSATYTVWDTDYLEAPTDYYRVQGCGLTKGSPPWFPTGDITGVTFSNHDVDGPGNFRFRIVNGNDSVLYSSSIVDASGGLNATVTYEIQAGTTPGFHNLSIRLEVASEAIDETQVIQDWISTGQPISNFICFGPLESDTDDFTIWAYNTEET